MKKLLSSSPFVLRVDENDVRTKLLAGGCSGALAAILLNPTELVKTRRMKGDSWQTIQTQVSKGRRVVLVERVLDGGIESGNFNGKSSGGVRGSETGVDENGAKR